MTRPRTFDPVGLVRILVKHHVDMVVIGGLGATIHGAELPTGDIDIMYALDDQNIQRLAAALLELEAGSADFPGLATDDLPALLSGSDLWRWQTKCGDFDMMSSASGAPPYMELKARALKVRLERVTVTVATLDDLIAMKETTGRRKDASKLRELMDLRQTINQAAAPPSPRTPHPLSSRGPRRKPPDMRGPGR
jgi:hypothetical protein